MRVKSTLATAGVAALLGTVLSATTANAETMTGYASRLCDIGGGDSFTIAAFLSADIASPTHLRPSPAESRVTAMMQLNDTTFATLGAIGFEGAFTVNLKMTSADGVSTRPMTMYAPQQPVYGNHGMKIPMVGYTPTIPHDGAAPTSVEIDTVDLHLNATKADGTRFDVRGTCAGDIAPWQRVQVDSMIAEIEKPPSILHMISTSTTTTSFVLGAAPAHPVLVGHEVLVDEQPVAATINGSTVDVAGLKPNTEHWIRVRALYTADKIPGKPSSPMRIHTAALAQNKFALSGKSVVKGATVPLTGQVHSDMGTFAHTSTLTLKPTTATMYLFGVLPVTATIELTPTGPAYGTLTGGVFKAAWQVGIAVPKVTFLGTPIMQSATCKTSAPAEVAVQSAVGFTPTAGGTLTGTYTIPPFANCGSATSWINAMAAGPGNTVDVKLTP